MKNYMTAEVRSKRGRDRIKRAAVGGGTGICVSFVTIGVGLISVPLTVQYLGAEQYGIWITISSFLAWLYVSDMGFGSALTNALATASGLEDVNLAKSLVATAFWTLILISIFILYFFFP
jgi:O-antigen/teichoic acid export membrane protein